MPHIYRSARRQTLPKDSIILVAHVKQSRQPDRLRKTRVWGTVDGPRRITSMTDKDPRREIYERMRLSGDPGGL